MMTCGREVFDHAWLCNLVQLQPSGDKLVWRYIAGPIVNPHIAQ
jgi:hypothetical protein